MRPTAFSAWVLSLCYLFLFRVGNWSDVNLLNVPAVSLLLASLALPKKKSKIGGNVASGWLQAFRAFDFSSNPRTSKQI